MAKKIDELTDTQAIRKGAEALERILDARTPEHKAVAEKCRAAKHKLGLALMEYYKYMLEESFHDYVGGHPANIPDALEFLAARADFGITEVLGALNDESWQDALPETAWWIISDIIDMLGTIERSEINNFWRGKHQQ